MTEPTQKENPAQAFLHMAGHGICKADLKTLDREDRLTLEGYLEWCLAILDDIRAEENQ